MRREVGHEFYAPRGASKFLNDLLGNHDLDRGQSPLLRESIDWRQTQVGREPIDRKGWELSEIPICEAGKSRIIVLRCASE